ncbi:MAG TPA: hypothetical protein P5127_06775, partial [Oscillospiraceae bacterium]|nr:hypothetical protein [Oscillospiraceae bacterium]
LKVEYKKTTNLGRFAFGPNLLYKPLTAEPFPTLNTDYSVYSSISFKVLNTTGRDIELEQLRFYASPITWFSPLVCGENTVKTVIPADGHWHTVNLDLNRLRAYGLNTGMLGSAHLLYKVIDIDLHFADKGGQIGDEGTIFIDDFSFSPNSNPLNINAAHNGLVLLSIMTRIISVINALF